MAKRKSFLSKIITWFMVLFFLAVLAVGALAACIYFQVVDDEKIQWANEKVGLYKLPLVGAGESFEYFTVPEGVVWPEPEENEEEDKDAVKVVEKDKKLSAEAATPPKPKEITISQKEIEEQTKAREAAEKKRVSKLARIYGSMKPEEAAQALDGVNLNTVVSILQKMDEGTAGQVLAKMDPVQAARVTQMMFNGNQ